MRILVLGAGGVGGYFGGRLAAAGVDVHFLVRPGRATILARQGLRIVSPLGDVRVPIKTITEAREPFDAIVLACKAYDLQEAMKAIAPAVGPSTSILPLLNGIRHLDNLDDRFGRDHVLGGLCHIGVTVTESGEIHHLNTAQRLVFGARTPAQAGSARAVHNTLTRGGFEPALSENVMQEMWEKFVFLATYAGMTTLFRAPVGTILATRDGETIMREMLTECTATATAEGYPPRADKTEPMTSALFERNSQGTASMFRDMAQGGPTEHQHIIGDMLNRARDAGIAAPLLRISSANMQAYDAVRMRQVAA